MKALRFLSVALLLTHVSEAWPAEILPDQSIAFWATFESRGEAQEYLGAFFRAKGYRLNATSEGLHFLYAGLPTGQHATAHGTIRPGVLHCVLVDLYSEELRSDVNDRSLASRARMAAEAAELVVWLEKAGAQSIRQFDARPWHKRAECLSARSNTSFERTREG
jgi:hypothetical protein